MYHIHNIEVDGFLCQCFAILLRSYQLGVTLSKREIRLTRRGAVRGMLTAPALSLPALMSARAPAQTRPTHAGAIDMHCHIFNGDDLPIKGFLEHAVFEARKHGRFEEPKAILAFLGNLLGRGAPSAKREASRLIGSLDGALGAADAGKSQDAVFVEQLTSAIFDLEQAAEGAEMNTFGVVRPPSMSDAKSLFDELKSITGYDDSFQGVAPAGEARLSRAREIANGLVLEHRARRDGSFMGAFISSQLAILRAIDFASIVLDWRSANVETYAELFGGNDGVAMMTPALVDFDHWVGSSASQDSSLAKQVEVMSLLARRESGILVHGMAPFDPLRDALSGGRDSFDLVRDAVESLGLVGVKIYPPMGFYPSDNEGRKTEVAEEIRTVRDVDGSPVQIIDNSSLNRDLDRALARLYDWAGDPQRRVPILAHARNSYGARRGYGVRARPAGWSNVLTKHRNLSVALAHIGDFSKFGNSTWEDDLPGLFSSAGGAYADLSYLSAAMEADKDKNHLKAQLLAAKFSDAARTRLLFGTDWLFVSLAAGNENYLKGLDDLLKAARFNATERRAVFHGNAVRFFGLAPGEPGRVRLERFYAAHGLDKARLAAVLDNG